MRRTGAKTRLKSQHTHFTPGGRFPEVEPSAILQHSVVEETILSLDEVLHPWSALSSHHLDVLHVVLVELTSPLALREG